MPTVHSDFAGTAGSLVEEWNARQASAGCHQRTIRPGDRVASVNGCTDGVVGLRLREIGFYAKSELVVKIVRDFAVEGWMSQTGRDS